MITRLDGRFDQETFKYLIFIEQMIIDVVNGETESLISEDLKKSLYADIDTDQAPLGPISKFHVT